MRRQQLLQQMTRLGFNKGINHGVIGAALKLLNAAPVSRMTKVEFHPLPNGNLEMLFRKKDKELNIEVVSETESHYMKCEDDFSLSEIQEGELHPRDYQWKELLKWVVAK